jgi:hypothetical protein
MAQKASAARFPVSTGYSLRARHRVAIGVSSNELMYGVARRASP